MCAHTQVSMPHRRGGNKKQEEEQQIAALAALTNAFLQEVKDVAKAQPDPQKKLVQIIIYESSV